MTDLNIKNVEEEIKKLEKQIEMHLTNIRGCEGAISYLKMMIEQDKKKEVK